MTPSDALIRSEHLARVHRAIDTLPPRQREVITLRMEGYTHAEIGERLGIAEGTSWSHARRAKQGIKRILWMM